MTAAVVVAVLPGATTAARPVPLPDDPLRLSFGAPVDVSGATAFQAAEPSIRVDSTDANQRIWIAAPAGILPGSRSLPESGEAGDLVWYSDDDGRSWSFVSGPAGALTGPTILGGGDSDVATGFGHEVYLTGLTLANITLTASCQNGEKGTYAVNPISNVGAVEDRQWIDTWEDRAKPALGPELVLTYGGVVERRIYLHQVAAPRCAPPIASERIDLGLPTCLTGDQPDCYQWPGNVALDERTGDVYVTYNTFGNDIDPTVGDKVVVARVDGAGNAPVVQTAAHVFAAASDRPDTFDSFTAVAVDRASNVYAVWSERHPERQATDTMLAVSRDRGATWSSPVQVNQGPQTTTFPWIVAGDAGRIDIVYYGTSEKGPSPEEVPAGSKWRVWMAQSLDALAAKPTFRENPATGFMHQGSICTSGTGCAAGTRDLLDYIQIDVDRGGMANIAYTDNLNTPPDGADPHQERVMFVQQKGGKGLFGS